MYEAVTTGDGNDFAQTSMVSDLKLLGVQYTQIKGGGSTSLNM